MKEYEKLFEKAREQYTAAKALLEGEGDNTEQANQLIAAGDKLKERAEALKATATKLEAVGAPQRTVPLPTEPSSEPPPAATKSDPNKNIYLARYGDESAEIKAVLLDLHGSDYEQKRWGGMTNFVKYLRTGEGQCRDYIWTPNEVKAAIAGGMDVQAMKATMVEAQDTLGGYAVPADFRAEVVSRMAGFTVVRPLARKITTSRDSVELPTMTGGSTQYRDAVRVTWVAETPASASTSTTNLTMGLQKIPVHTVMANTDLSRNLVEDAAFNLVAWLAESFGLALAIDEDNKFLVGDGNGKPEGVLRDSGIGALGTGQQVVSGSASTLLFDGLKSLTFGLDRQYRQRAVFVMNKATALVAAKLKDGDGQYLWSNNYGDNSSQGGAGKMPTLLGYPVYEQEGMPDVGANTFPIIFGDFMGYAIVDRIGLSVERFVDSTTAVSNYVRYVARRRVGGQVIQVNHFVAQKCST